jgi:replication factor C large subunit
MEDWTEKYRPKSLDEVVGNERAVNELRRWANSWNNGTPKKRAVILSGKPGIGKTSAAIALANDYGWTIIELNTSDARNATKIRNVATFGAINETFDDQGRFVSSSSGGRKLIVLDEADNLYEKIRQTSSKDNNDLSDKGGKKAIIETIKITSQPIVLIVNDYYGLTRGGGEVLKSICTLIKFYDPYPSSVLSLLKRICLREGVTVDQRVLKNISDRCKGDIRSAINDLQSICLNRKQVDMKALDVLGYRDREKDIFGALRDIFKTKNIQNIRENLSNLDADPKSIMLWVNENLPNEYLDVNDLARGYDMLSKADVFLGRTHRRQNFGLWSYACDLMNGGVATAKTHSYPNERYNFPSWLIEKKSSKNNRDIRNSIIEKISRLSHNSMSKNRDFLSTYFTHMFRNDTYFAIKMKNKCDFTENEIKHLLGDKYNYKLRDILVSSETDYVKPIKETMGSDETIKKEKDKEIQQTLF